MKWIKGVAIAFFVTAFSYFVIIPVVGGACTTGKMAVDDNGTELKIVDVIPWPNKHLYCYRVVWYSDGRKFPGYSYVDKTTLK